MKSKSIEIKDKRETGYYIVDNEILDNYTLSPLAIVLYNFLCRFSGRDSKEAFLSMSAFSKRYKCGRNTIKKSRDELISRKIISGGKLNAKGIQVFTLENKGSWSTP